MLVTNMLLTNIVIARRDRNAAGSPGPIASATLVSQIPRLEHVTGTTLLRTGPDGMAALTTDDGQFTRDVRPVPASLAQSREKDASHTP